jgi:hypothetical protein
MCGPFFVVAPLWAKPDPELDVTQRAGGRMTTDIQTPIASLGAAGWTISVIAILIVAAIGWNVFDGREDVRRLSRRLRRRRRR